MNDVNAIVDFDDPNCFDDLLPNRFSFGLAKCCKAVHENLRSFGEVSNFVDGLFGANGSIPLVSTVLMSNPYDTSNSFVRFAEQYLDDATEILIYRASASSEREERFVAELSRALDGANDTDTIDLTNLIGGMVVNFGTEVAIAILESYTNAWKGFFRNRWSARENGRNQIGYATLIAWILRGEYDKLNKHEWIVRCKENRSTLVHFFAEKRIPQNALRTFEFLRKKVAYVDYDTNERIDFRDLLRRTREGKKTCLHVARSSTAIALILDYRDDDGFMYVRDAAGYTFLSRTNRRTLDEFASWFRHVRPRKRKRTLYDRMIRVDSLSVFDELANNWAWKKLRYVWAKAIQNGSSKIVEHILKNVRNKDELLYEYPVYSDTNENAFQNAVSRGDYAVLKVLIEAGMKYSQEDYESYLRGTDEEKARMIKFLSRRR